MMKKTFTARLQAPCFFCLLNRAWIEIQLATDDHEKQIKTMRAFLKILHDQTELLNEFAPDDERQSPTWIGTLRERTIKRLTGNPDYYAAQKQQANEEAMKILPTFENQINKSRSKQERFRIACLAAVAANAMETGVFGHQFSLSQLHDLLGRAETELAIDQISDLFIEAKKANKILYITDNAGEIAFDTLFVKELTSLATVTVAVKDQPVMNDVTLQDAETVGMTQITDVITLGTDCVGTILSEVSDSFRRTFFSANLVIGKGMGNLESLSVYDIRRPVIYVLYRTKCQRIADFSGIPQNRNVVARLDYLKKSIK
ncbi:MAG: DUF89 domain-containing protein [Candidatus Heimdallarchaeota archaeon]